MDKDFLNEFLNKIGGDKDGLDRFIVALRGGENSVSHFNFTQSVQMQDDWIIEIENALTSVEQIVHRPRKFIAENELLLDVAKVKRTTTKTVRHLTTHSQFVQNYEKDSGEVTPKKLLSVEMDEDIAIYENRFICALINNLIKFVEVRNDEMKDRIESFNQTNVNMQSKFTYGESRFTCNIDLKVDDPINEGGQNETNLNLYERVQTLRRRLRMLQTTEFMKVLNRAKPVRPPIQKTNLLMKNVDYNNCYKLWLFVSSYRFLGYSATVQSKSLPVDGDYYDDLTVMMGLSLESMLSNNVLKRERYEAIEFSEPVEKEYKVINNFVFKPEFDNSAEDCGSDTINEYYYRKIKDELVSKVSDGELGVEHRLNVNFAKFFRSISRINDAMYSELIEDEINPSESGENSLLNLPTKTRQKMLVKRQKERVKRRKLFLKLKWEEVERAQRMLEREEAKFYTLKDEYDGVRKASKSARFTKRKFKTKKEE
ncbi:MAG: DUF2357 domain-containing protein [Candidatus Coproplasma sp.]